MSSPALTLYTDRPDYSSAGASKMIFIKPCDPTQFDFDDSDEQMATIHCFPFPNCSQTDGMEAFVGVCVPEDSEGFQLSEAQSSRLLCHFLVQQLPDLAFEEAVESLTGMYEFYRESPVALLSPPPPIQSVKARITGSYTAPVYPVTEE